MARVDRFAEEHELVIEEMKRVRRWFAWRTTWWRDRIHSGRQSVSRLIAEGRTAYAFKQSHLLSVLAEKFVSLWKVILRDLKLDPEIIDDL